MIIKLQNNNNLWCDNIIIKIIMVMKRIIISDINKYREVIFRN